MTDFRLQRLNMVESQIRPSDVTDQRIIRAMLEVPRERFVPADAAAIAYIDDPVPLAPRPAGGTPRSLLPPRTFAKLVQLAEVGPQSVVLDVGCATGYSTAVLARIAARVVALEADHGLAQQAAATLQELGAGNAVVIEGPLAAGAPARGPFDAILLNGAVPAVAARPARSARRRRPAGGGAAPGTAVPRASVAPQSGKVVDCQPAFEAAAATLPGFEEPVEFVF